MGTLRTVSQKVTGIRNNSGIVTKKQCPDHSCPYWKPLVHYRSKGTHACHYALVNHQSRPVNSEGECLYAIHSK